MSGKKRERLKSRAFRAQVRSGLAAKLSISAIAKKLDASYEHTRLIAMQESDNSRRECSVRNPATLRCDG
jgi:hypothetical protein